MNFSAPRLSILVAAAVVLIAPSPLEGQSYVVGLRFSDNSTSKTITTAETANLEVFVQIPASFVLAQYFVAFTESAPNNQELSFSSGNNSIPGWNYSSTLTGNLADRFTSASLTPGNQVPGPLTLVLDSITITPSTTGSYTIDPGAVGVDVIIADYNLPSPSTSINPSFAAVSLTVSAVPEPSAYAAVFGVASLGLGVYLRRRKTG